MLAASIGHTSVQLLGCFEMTSTNGRTHLPLQAQRVVAYLAVASSRTNRRDLAARLWPFTNQIRAQGNLRTAIWRIRQEAPDAIDSGRELVALGPDVEVDYHELLDSQSPAVNGLPDLELLSRLRHDLLPGWDEEWLLVERERTRQLRLRRLEALSRHYTETGDIDDAIRAAYAAIEIEPLRESAHLGLIEAHVADGNMAVAFRQVKLVTQLMQQDLGVAPSDSFVQRINDLGLKTASAEHRDVSG